MLPTGWSVVEQGAVWPNLTPLPAVGVSASYVAPQLCLLEAGFRSSSPCVYKQSLKSRALSLCTHTACCCSAETQQAKGRSVVCDAGMHLASRQQQTPGVQDHRGVYIPCRNYLPIAVAHARVVHRAGPVPRARVGTAAGLRRGHVEGAQQRSHAERTQHPSRCRSHFSCALSLLLRHTAHASRSTTSRGAGVQGPGVLGESKALWLRSTLGDDDEQQQQQ